jgi:hypothetical protein
VVTEITELSVSLTALANTTGGKAYIELALAKPPTLLITLSQLNKIFIDEEIIFCSD